MGLPLGSEAIRLLEERTEGWIAGIQLVTLALRGHADAAVCSGRRVWPIAFSRTTCVKKSCCGNRLRCSAFCS